ncbi:hypothetical protein GZL_01971 [Streptomyces sp. 769]|nr:hypothetical protein GZL_01971 [Streptomyces sp. 769]
MLRHACPILPDGRPSPPVPDPITAAPQPQRPPRRCQRPVPHPDRFDDPTVQLPLHLTLLVSRRGGHPTSDGGRADGPSGRATGAVARSPAPCGPARWPRGRPFPRASHQSLTSRYEASVRLDSRRRAHRGRGRSHQHGTRLTSKGFRDACDLPAGI